MLHGCHTWIISQVQEDSVHLSEVSMHHQEFQWWYWLQDPFYTS